MNSVILQGADHFKPSSIANVRESRIAMTTEISLQDSAVSRSIEKRTPRFQFAHARGRFLGVKLRHAPAIKILPTAHRIGKVNAPIVSVVHIAHRRGYATFRHYGMSFAEERFGDHGDFYTSTRSFYSRSQTGASGTNDQNIVLVGDVLGH
jgi:hypothetical protein